MGAEQRLVRALEETWLRARRAVPRLRDRRAKQETEDLAAMEARLDAERSLAAARGEEHAVPFELGVRWDVGAPLPHLLASGQRTFLAFYLHEPDPDWDGTYVRIVDPAADEPVSLALVELVGCVAVKLGPPNEEVLDGHPLAGRGLDAYEPLVVVSSSWIAELAAVNSVHPQFDPARWRELRHYLFPFHDETFEAVARDVRVETSREPLRALLARTLDRLLE